jgi:hypothetical protein
MKFTTNPLPSQCRVLSNVSTKVFKLFLSALKDETIETIEVTKVNFRSFSALCEEFGFELESPSYRLGQVEVAIEELKNEIGRLSHKMREIERIPAVTAEISNEIAELRVTLSTLWKFPGIPRLNSQIISDFPEIFREFRGKQFSVLWRGSRDGFKSQTFHDRCDGHSNTLTVIFDTKGNIFGGFTPLKWESQGGLKADNDEKSFLFTLKNPHNIPARIFRLKTERKNEAIRCGSRFSPWFEGGIFVSDNCNANTSCTLLGLHYINDTGLDGKIVFTGSEYFQVKEIEVLEITD